MPEVERVEEFLSQRRQWKGILNLKKFPLPTVKEMAVCRPGALCSTGNSTLFLGFISAFSFLLDLNLNRSEKRKKQSIHCKLTI